MTAATFIGSTLNPTSGPASRVVTPHASTLEGDLIIVIAEAASATATLTAPGDWNLIKSFVATGTLGSAAWGKKRAAGDTSYTFPIAASAFSQHLCLTIRGWQGDFANIIIGATGTRAASGGAFATTAPSVTTFSVDNLVLLIGTERTTAVEAGISGANNGFTELIFCPHAAGGSETIWVGSKVVQPGAVGASTITYLNSQTSNAMAFLLAIAPGVVVPTVGFAWFNSMEKNAIRAAWSIANASSIRAVVSLSSDLSSPMYSSPVAPNASGWVSARVTGLEEGTLYYIGIEADGVLLAGGRLKGKTITEQQVSFKFITGSCQYTGSNHVVFDSMNGEQADFFIHQGDIHYADTSIESVWRAQLTQSLTAPRFKQLMSTLPMPYTWDNHDYAGQGQEADDWDEVNNPQKFIRELMGEFHAVGEIYRTWIYGRVRFIQTDQWSERDPDEAPETSEKRCMSQLQEEWLYDTLLNAGEPIIIWATLWPLYRSVPGGRWGSYTTQRNRIKAWLADHPDILSRIVAIGGDSHSVSSDTGVNQDALGKIPTLNSSPFNQTGGLPSGTWDIVNFDTVDADGYFSLVTITDDGDSMTLKWDAVNQTGSRLATWSKTFDLNPGLPTSLEARIVTGPGTSTLGHIYVWNGTTAIPVDHAVIVP